MLGWALGGEVLYNDFLVKKKVGGPKEKR